MTKTISLSFAFPDDSKFDIVLIENSGTPHQQIKDFILNNIDKRGRMVFIYGFTSNFTYNDLEEGDEITAYILQDDIQMRNHIRNEGMLENGFIYCGNIAMQRHGAVITNVESE